ncbi:MAG TPA: hypothetical protein VK590_14935 [Saprospiraceae bacterium]|nr:hypothetical protein [Saprospiraceae bacterium]
MEETTRALSLEQAKINIAEKHGYGDFDKDLMLDLSPFQIQLINESMELYMTSNRDAAIKQFVDKSQCFYEPDNTTAMNCKHCGKSKWLHNNDSFTL